MQIGVKIPTFSGDGRGVREFIVGAEEMGFDSVWTGDHYILPARTRSHYQYRWRFDPDLPDLFPNKNYLEAVASCGFIAGTTERVRIGVGVFVFPMRNPVAFAKELVTLDVLSEGRMIVGAGSGWLKEEFEALGVPFEDRGARLEEYVKILRTLWSEKQPVSFEGRFFSFEDMHCEPVPYSRGGPPIWFGGHTDIALKRCARLGSGWNAVELSPKDFAEHNEKLSEFAAAAGRSPGELERSVSTRLKLTGDSLAQTAEVVSEYQSAGCDHLIVYSTPDRSPAENLERVRRLKEEVLPSRA